jgi:TM2 domain-containing membrane protein YozV
MSEANSGDDRVSLGKGDPDPSAWSAAPDPYPPPASYPPPAQSNPASAPYGPPQPYGQTHYGQPQQYGQTPYGQPPQYGQASYGQPGGYGHDPSAPYGRDPMTGEPLSDKSKIVAGLLQFFIGWLGIGRFYMGSTAIGVSQLILFVLSIPLLALFGLGLILWFGVALWAFIDAIVILTGRPRDGQGLLLRS